MDNNEKYNIDDHPFPVKEMDLMLRLNLEEKIPFEDITIISNLLYKYLELRSHVFHDY